MKQLLALSLLACLLFTACSRETTNDYFATCIAESGAQFYGTFWCPHCADQKALFGDSVDLLPYVECDPNGKDSNVQACDEAGVTQFPTWIFADGTTVLGVQSFDELSQATGCPLPGNESIMVQSGSIKDL